MLKREEVQLFFSPTGEDNSYPQANPVSYLWNGCLPGSVWSSYANPGPSTAQQVEQNQTVFDVMLCVHSGVCLLRPSPVVHELHGHPPQTVSRVEDCHIHTVYKNFRGQGKKSRLVRPLDLRHVYCLFHAICRIFYIHNNLPQIHPLGSILWLACPYNFHVQLHVPKHLLSFQHIRILYREHKI